MALNLADRIAVRALIVPRCAAAVVQYANFLLGFPEGPGNENPRQTATTAELNWARASIKTPGNVGDAVSWHILNHADFIDDGSGIADNVLQSAVETALNNHFIGV